MKHLIPFLFLSAAVSMADPVAVGPNGEGVNAAAFRTAISSPSNAEMSSAIGLKVNTSDLSTNGGANKVAQFDASAYLRTGAINPLGGGTNPGGLRIPAQQRITWEREDDGVAVANVWMFDKHPSSHDANYYPELVWSSPRHCYYWVDGFQMGDSTSGPGQRGWRFVYFNPLGQACAAGTSLGGTLDTQMESVPVLLRSEMWDGSQRRASNAAVQYIATGAAAGDLTFWTGGTFDPGGTSARGRILASGGYNNSLTLNNNGPLIPSGKTLQAAGNFTLTQNSVEVLKSDSASALANTLRITNGKVRIGTGSSAAASLPFEVWRQSDAGNTTGEFYIDSNGKVFVGRLSSTGGNSSTGLVVQTKDGAVSASFNPSTSASTIGTNTLSVSSASTFSNTTDATSSAGAIRTSGGVSVAKKIYAGTGLTIAAPTVPASATATGTAGEIAWDADYIYVCVATNTWKRSAIATW